MDPEELLCRPQDGPMCEPETPVVPMTEQSAPDQRVVDTLDAATADMVGQQRPQPPQRSRPAQRSRRSRAARRSRQSEAPQRRESSVSADELAEARDATHIPEEGFDVAGARGQRRRLQVNTRGVDDVAELMRDPAMREHVERTLQMFESDPEHPIRREDIDLPYVLATSLREGGARSALSLDDDRVVSAGRDLHTAGASGMDHLWNRRAEFPAEMRDEIQRVRGNPEVPGHFTNRRGNETAEPAFLPGRDMLAAHIVEAAAREQMFRRRFERAFSERNGFTDEEREALLGGMSQDARRAWTQATFGSQSPALLREARNRIRRAEQQGRSLEEIAADPSTNLDTIITDDTMMPDSLSRQRCRMTAAESRLIENELPEELRPPERRTLVPPRTRQPARSPRPRR